MEGFQASGKKQFKDALQQCESCLFLIFEDVQNPEMIMPLLPSDKHCVIFTSYSDLAWRELHLIPSHVTSIQVKPLTTSESLCLIGAILKKVRKIEVLGAYIGSQQFGQFKSFLEDGLQNLPLAVRLLAFQLIEGRFKWKTSLSSKSFLDDRLDQKPTLDQRAAGRVHVRGFFHVINSALQHLPPDVASSPLFFALAIFPPSGVSVWFIEQLMNKKLNTANVIKDLLRAGLITLDLENYTIVMHQVIQHYVRSLMRCTGSERMSGISRATVSLARTVCRADSASFICKGGYPHGVWLLNEFLPKRTPLRSQTRGKNLVDLCAVEIERALFSFITNVREVKMSLTDVLQCCRAINSSMQNRYIPMGEATPTWQMLQNCLAKFSTDDEVKLQMSSSLLSIHHSSLEAYWYFLPPRELYGDALQRLSPTEINTESKIGALVYAVATLVDHRAYWQVINLFAKLDFSLSLLLQKFRKTRSTSFIANALWLSIALGGAGEFVHAEKALFLTLQLCGELNVRMENHIDLVLKSANMLGMAISELGQSERALMWWEITYTLHWQAYDKGPPYSTVVALSHNSLRCCNQSHLGETIKQQVLNWVWRIDAHKPSTALSVQDGSPSVKANNVLIQEAFRQAFQYFVNCKEEQCPEAEFVKERLAGYFAKYDKFSSACKPLLKPTALVESDSTKERQDPLELRRLLIRMCRAVASSNVLPSSPEGISLLIDAVHTRYVRHGSLNDLFAQMMTSGPLQHVFKEFLAASGDYEDVGDVKVPKDITALTPSWLLGAVSQILRDKGEETCANAVDALVSQAKE